MDSSDACSGSQSAAAGMAEVESATPVVVDNHSLRVLLHIARSHVRDTTE